MSMKPAFPTNKL